MLLFDNDLPRINGKVRLMHAIPTAPNIDVYANGNLIYSNLGFGRITDYLDIPAGKYDIELYEAGKKESPLLKTKFEVTVNCLNTIAVTDDKNQIVLFVLDDTHTISNPLLSSVRFVNLSPDSEPLSLKLHEDTVLFEQVGYLQENNYYPISPDIYNFIVYTANGTFEKYINNIKLRKAQFVTIYIIGLFNGTPKEGYILVTDGVMQNTRKVKL